MAAMAPSILPKGGEAIAPPAPLQLRPCYGVLGVGIFDQRQQTVYPWYIQVLLKQKADSSSVFIYLDLLERQVMQWSQWNQPSYILVV